MNNNLAEQSLRTDDLDTIESDLAASFESWLRTTTQESQSISSASTLIAAQGFTKRYASYFKSLINTDRERAVLEARLDELKKLDDEHQTTSQDLQEVRSGYTQACVPCQPIWDRKTELEAQLSALTKEVEE